MRGDQNRQWTEFETALFNLVTTKRDRPIDGYFSSRLYVTKKMLEAFDRAVDEINWLRGQVVGLVARREALTKDGFSLTWEEEEFTIHLRLEHRGSSLQVRITATAGLASRIDIIDATLKNMRRRLETVMRKKQDTVHDLDTEGSLL